MLSCANCSDRLANQSTTVANSDQPKKRNPAAVNMVWMDWAILNVSGTKSILLPFQVEIEQALHKIEVTSCNNQFFKRSLLRVSPFQNEVLENDGSSCPICNKSFGRKSSLINHIKNHAAEKKFTCDYCKKGECGVGFPI